MFATSSCRLLGDRHLWDSQALATAVDLTATARARYDHSLRWIHLHLHEINGAGTIMARIHMAPVAGREITTAAVRNDAASALDAAFDSLRTRLPPIQAVPVPA